ncbi:hypothetical protein PC120_g22084 [Phytophthora cactorum]|nr:hypothetical protein PC120_g22084 [Phytophthora cactorum]
MCSFGYLLATEVVPVAHEIVDAGRISSSKAIQLSIISPLSSSSAYYRERRSRHDISESKAVQHKITGLGTIQLAPASFYPLHSVVDITVTPSSTLLSACCGCQCRNRRFNAAMIPASSGCNLDVVIGGKKNKKNAF